MKTKNLILFTILILICCGLKAQDKKRCIGMSGTIQSNQYGINLPIWLNNHFVLAPAFHFTFAEGSGTDYSIGIAPRYYFKNEGIAPYLGVKAGILINDPTQNTLGTAVKTKDYLLGVGFGGEYFLSNNFSFGVELQGNFSISDEKSYRFDNPGKTAFNTATMISATVYF